MKRAWLGLVALGAAACDYGFAPETLLLQLRVVGASSEPAELRPGETARLSVLAVDPSRPGQRSSVLWVGCDPDPFNQNRGACSDPAVLQDPSRLGSVDNPPGGLSILGFNDQARLTAPAGLFSVFPPDDPRRASGTVAQQLAIAVAEDVPLGASQEQLAALLGRVQDGGVRSQATLFRVRITESSERNQNPRASGLVVADEAWPTGARVMLLPGERVELDVRVPAETFEPYTAQTPAGPEARTERVLVAWYSTAGRFSESSTALGEAVRTAFTAPGVDAADPVPSGRRATVYAVLRDTRGGVSWSEYQVYVCDPQTPRVELRGAQVAPTPDGGTLELTGQNLNSVLQLVLDGAVLGEPRFDPASGRLSAPWPGGPPRPVTVHTRGCQRFGVDLSAR